MEKVNVANFISFYPDDCGMKAHLLVGLISPFWSPPERGDGHFAA
jgi:hypothetical protein